MRNLKIIAIVFVVISALGFIDATYLTFQHFSGNIPPCTIDGCEIVLTSQYATIAGIPVALLGSIYYLTLLILSILFLDSKKVNILRLASYITIAGLGTSLYLVYLMFFVIQAVCQYCLVSATTSTLLFIAGLYVIFKTSKKQVANKQTISPVSNTQ
ncbi:hypothetical protein A3J61_00140 [Candidatus Nomurabacteria bacterium RIFCSPHIGHO2_02_FULL_38_15]|uniref:Vitamin K epoxide reductase domain-containing protein n=1 Tax=Candidatus Nomurabacteria bacterium RIFCSPHIGHO2_02_FULL_38_15 TaxID=1801752 RepID=A0A1F6VSR9_9BACT|nr:MAG: hypothetical protein A3J61_00140 [Candidatus Nomurabacteria bacterium RIFCSPHIGHO2_02_FULL_38_15]